MSGDAPAFDEAVQGVNGIVNSASPFVFQVEDYFLTDMLSTGFADYADVAEAYLLAYKTPAAAGERFLVAAGN
ncbi:hypothetical protein DTO271G3_7626 [Paecilomyces variotii]|nr:hypothetical protein DTO271G3_7626 [Paecilomyces variotii]